MGKEKIQIAQLNGQIENLKKALINAHEENQRLHGDIDRLTAKLATVQTERNTASENLALSELRSQALLEKLTAFQKQCEVLTTNNETLRKQNTTLIEQLTAAVEELRQQAGAATDGFAYIPERNISDDYQASPTAIPKGTTAAIISVGSGIIGRPPSPSTPNSTSVSLKENMSLATQRVTRVEVGTQTEPPTP